MSPIPASPPGQQPSAPCPKSRTSAAKWQTSAAKCIKASSFRSAPRPSRASPLTGSYSFLNRNIHYDFSPEVPTVSPINTSIIILPTVPRNKLIGTATARLPWRVLGIVQVRYEGGLTLQDTSYPTASPPVSAVRGIIR